MAYLNENFLKLPGSYLFSEVNKRVRAHLEQAPGKQVLRLGIGDVTLPLSPGVVGALHASVDEMAKAETFRGYAPEAGYPFLIDAIKEYEYAPLGISIDTSEIFVGDGAKSDTANIQELFDEDAIIAVTDPVYPVYVDSNVMAGRSGDYISGRYSKIIYMPMTKENGYKPALPDQVPDLIYICSPNNPTGASLTASELKVWVDYALEHGSIILFDAAYRSYIQSLDAVHSIYEVPGAKGCAIEFCSYSKTAGFTGTRCSWVVVPKELELSTKSGQKASLNALWLRRQATKFNGTAYIVQKAAAAIYTEQGRQEVEGMVSHYMKNAGLIRETLLGLGIEASGGVDAPYIWFPVPGGDSWAFFDTLLSKTDIVGTPGAGFGPSGEGYFRLTAFGSPENTKEACRRMREVLK